MISQRKRIAVIGAGVSGLGAAWALRESADVAVYEKADRIGGHAWTVDIDYDGVVQPVDIGFICFNRPNYPNFTAMLEHLGVATVTTDMSFAVSDPQGYEWGSDPLGLFAWKRNLLDRNFHGLLAEILRFNTRAREQLEANTVSDTSLGEWLDTHGFSQRFRTGYLLPMSAAIWSTPERMMLDYPVSSFLTFFDNHRLMHAVRPTWRTVSGGSRTYVSRLVQDMRLVISGAATSVRPALRGGVDVTDVGGRTQSFDAAILASHADASLGLLDPSYEDQRLALGSVRFSSNIAYLHRDPALMPKRRAAWASWNVIKGQDETVCITYWMNRLQAIPRSRPVFVTLNPAVPPAVDKTFGIYEFDHPMYDGPSAAARRTIQRVQGMDGLYFAGAWLGDGFHEAGLRSGIEAALALGGSVPWTPTVRHTHAAPVAMAHKTASQAARA